MVGTVSSTSAWIDPSAQNAKGETPSISAKTVACIEVLLDLEEELVEW